MKKIIFTTLLISFVTFQFNSQIINRQIGTNLSDIKDYSPEVVFVNVFNQSRKWIAHEYGFSSPWSSGVHVPLGANGYPLEIPYDNTVDPLQKVRSLLFFGNMNNLYTGGNYRLIVSGQGQISMSGAAYGTFKCPVDTMVYVDSSLGGIMLEIDTSLVTNPIHDIRFLMPGYGNYLTNPFNPKLINFIKDFQVLRFMDWMETNSSPVKTWADRNTKANYTQTLHNGIAYEYIIDICNQNNISPWICVPHRANNQYITNLARLFRDSLNPNLIVHIEYSNEVWNSIFNQHHYADSMGNALGYSGSAWEKGWKFYAKRTADVHRIFETEFSDTSRIYKVISSQSAVSYISDFILKRYKEVAFNPTLVKADGLAIAPYFAGSVATNIATAGLMSSSTVSSILDSMQISLQESYRQMKSSKIIADTHNIELIAYEGGQHLVTRYPFDTNIVYVNKLISANNHSRMQAMYCEYFNYWYDSVNVDLFCNFSSHGTPSRYGSWGVKRYYNDTLSPKYLGLKSCVFSHNSLVGIKEIIHQNNSMSVYPNPSQNGEITIKHTLLNPNIRLYDNVGRLILFKVISNYQNEIKIKANNYKGLAFVLLQDSKAYYSERVIFVDL